MCVCVCVSVRESVCLSVVCWILWIDFLCRCLGGMSSRRVELAGIVDERSENKLVGYWLIEMMDLKGWGRVGGGGRFVFFFFFHGVQELVVSGEGATLVVGGRERELATDNSLDKVRGLLGAIGRKLWMHLGED